jgi:hypothetical protein
MAHNFVTIKTSAGNSRHRRSGARNRP